MISFMVVALLLQAYAFLQLYRMQSLHRILSFCLIFYMLLWMTLPGVLSLAIHSGFLGDSYASDTVSNGYIVLYAVESLVFLACVALALVACRCGIVPRQRRSYRPIHGSRIVLLLVVFVLVGLAIQVATAGADYLDRNDASTYDEQRGVALLEMIANLLRAALVLVFITERSRRRIVVLVFAGLALSAVQQTLGGSRIAMLLPVFVYLARLHYQSSDPATTFYRMVVVSVLVLVTLLPTALLIGRVRGEGAISAQSIEDSRAQAVALADLAADVYTKFNSYSSGLDLIQGYGLGSAGLTPYVGSALVFLPRSLFPGRPVAGSVDGTIYGTPSRLVPQLFGSSESMNVGVSPLAVSAWQFGPLAGSLALWLAGTTNLVLLQYLISRRGWIPRVLAVYAVGIPTFAGIFSSPDALLKNAMEVGILVALLSFLAMLLMPGTKQRRRAATSRSMASHSGQTG